VCVCVCVCTEGIKSIHILRMEKTVLKFSTRFIPITKDKRNLLLTSAITRGTQSVYRRRLDSSDYGELLLEHH